MSQRTIVEFNHDCAGEIAEDQKGFARAIQQMLNGGVNDNESALRDVLRSFGVSTSPTHHHTMSAEVVFSNESGGVSFRRRFT